MPTNFSTLTAKQKKVYLAIESYIKLKGIPPTVREIGEIIGERTPGAVQGILNRLEQKGVIKREVGMARSIKILADNSQYAEPLYVPYIKKVNSRSINDLLGIYNLIGYMPLSPNMLSSHKTCFMLDCPDGSLAQSGISYEDILLFEREPELNDNDIILVLYENHALLRRYYLDEDQKTVILKADSDLIGRETFKRDEIVIVGKLVGKYTKY